MSACGAGSRVEVSGTFSNADRNNAVGRPVNYPCLSCLPTQLSVPLIREGRALGAINVRRTEVRPFEQTQIALLTTFANQAAIAIENVRLFEAEQQRTLELTNSLQQQTATADVLKVIGRSAFDLQAVLDTLTESAARLCEAEMATIIRQKGTAYYWATNYGFPPELREYLESVPLEPGRGSGAGRV